MHIIANYTMNMFIIFKLVIINLISVYHLVFCSKINLKKIVFKILKTISKILNGETDVGNFSCNLTPGLI